MPHEGGREVLARAPHPEGHLREVQPTLFFAVPRIWEKLHAASMIKGADATWIKRKLFRFGMKLNKQIAGDLGIHERTVKVHRKSIMTKLEVRSVAALVRLTQEMKVTTSSGATFP